MKNRFLFLPVLGFCIITLMSACGDDEGQSIQDLLIGEWALDEEDGTKVSGFTFVVELESNGDYKETYTSSQGTSVYRGEWTLIGQEIEIEYDDGDQEELEVVAVTGDLLIVEDEDRTELVFERN